MLVELVCSSMVQCLCSVAHHEELERNDMISTRFLLIIKMNKKQTKHVLV